MRHVVGEPFAGEDIVVVGVEFGLRVLRLHPKGHVDADPGAEAVGVEIAVDHLVVEIVLREASAVATADVLAARLERRAQGGVVELLEPRLYPLRGAPVDVVAAQGNPVGIGPGEDRVDGGVLHFAALLLHAEPLQRVLGDRGIEVLEEHLLVACGVGGGHRAVEGLVGEGGAEPEFMTELLDHDGRARCSGDDEGAHAVLADRVVERGAIERRAGGFGGEGATGDGDRSGCGEEGGAEFGGEQHGDEVGLRSEGANRAVAGQNGSIGSGPEGVVSPAINAAGGAGGVRRLRFWPPTRLSPGRASTAWRSGARRWRRARRWR